MLPRAISGTAISDSGSGGVPSTKRTRGIEVGAIREHRLALLDGPARDPLSECERLVGEHLVRVLAPGKDGTKVARAFVRLVEREVVVRNQLADRVGDPLEERVE